ncbi:hypothetical protein DRH27_03760, partial [Candidatus Falkowbacteria bacterium]
TDGNLTASIRGGSSAVHNLDILGEPAILNNWYHYVMTYDGITLKSYVDGTLTKEAAGVTGAWTATWPPIRFGNYEDLAGLDFEGWLDEILIANRTLDIAEIQNLYEEGRLTALKIIGRDARTNAIIPTFNVTFTNGSFYSTTTGNITLTNWTNGNYSFTIRANNYINNVVEEFEHINITVKNVLLTAKNELDVNIRDLQTGALITSLVNVTVQSNPTETYHNTTTGNLLLNLTSGESYKLIFQAINYTVNDIDITLTDAQAISGLTAYLEKNATAVTINVKDSSGDAIEAAQIQIYNYVNGNLTLIAQKSTDVLGAATFNLILDTNYVFNISKTGYTTQTSTVELTSTGLSFTLVPSSGITLDGPTTGVNHLYNPKNTTLAPQFVTFSWLVVPTNEALSSFSINIYNGSTVLNTTISYNSVGGTIYAGYNFSAYENKTIIVKYAFQKDGYDEVVFNKGYLILAPTNLTITAQNARQFAANNLPLALRVSLWVFLTLIIMLILASLRILGSNNVIISLLVSIIPAWYLALELGALGAIITVMIIIFIRRSGESVSI